MEHLEGEGAEGFMAKHWDEVPWRLVGVWKREVHIGCLHVPSPPGPGKQHHMPGSSGSVLLLSITSGPLSSVWGGPQYCGEGDILG